MPLRGLQETYLDNVLQQVAPGARLLLSWALPEACLPGRVHGHLNCRENAHVIRRLFVRGFLFHEAHTAWLRAQARPRRAPAADAPRPGA